MASVQRTLLADGLTHTAGAGTTGTSLQAGLKDFIYWVSVTAFTGTNFTATLQHSADGVEWFSVGAPAAFTATGQKILDQASFTVAGAKLLPNVRVLTSGTFSSVTFTAGIFADPK